MKSFQGKKMGSTYWGICTVKLDETKRNLYQYNQMSTKNNAWEIEYQSANEVFIRFKLFHGSMAVFPPPEIGEDITINKSE